MTVALVVVDEIGRGTSTEDGAARRPVADVREIWGGKNNEKSSCSVGTALAHAVLRTLADAASGPLCLFTTHFFELTRMEGDEHASLANFHVDALARDGALTLLYEVKPGASAASFGVECAALAGFPAAVVAEARHHKIALRCGDFLSPRLLDAVLPADARPAGVVRVSLAHYNTVAEVDRLCAALERMEKW